MPSNLTLYNVIEMYSPTFPTLLSPESYGTDIFIIKANPSINPKITNLYLMAILMPNTVASL